MRITKCIHPRMCSSFTDYYEETVLRDFLKVLKRTLEKTNYSIAHAKF